jgi:hypothetical protein
MIIDRFNEFSDAQAPDTVATHASTNVVDLKAAGAIESKPHYLHVKVNTTVTSDGNATVTFLLQTDSAEDFGSATTLWTSAAIGKATLVAGYEVVRLPINGLPLKRYVRVAYTIGTAALTAGKFDAFLSADADSNEF